MANVFYPDFTPSGPLGDVDGPAGATDNALARYDGATGKIIQNSTAILSDAGDLTLNGSCNLTTNIGGGILAFGTYSLSTLNQPYLSYPVTTYGILEINGIHGGLSIVGLTDNGSNPISFSGIIGSTTPTQAAIQFISSKADGAGGIQALSASEKVFTFNNVGSTIFDLYGDAGISINNASRANKSKLNIKADANSTGTGTITNGGTKNVVGTGTLFTSELSVGDKIIVSGASCTVISITDDTHLQVDYFGNWVNAAFTISKPITRFMDNSNNIVNTTYSTGETTAATIRTTQPLSSICFGPLPGVGPQLAFGFGDTTIDHVWRSAGGANQDIIFEVFGGSAHFWGVGGLFKTQYGATIGDSSYNITPPTNGLVVTGRISGSFGANVTAANDTTLGNDGNVFTITGNTTINGIATANWRSSSQVILYFTGTPTVKHDTAASAGFGRIFLAGSVDLVASNGTVLSLFYNGTEWQEFSRKVP